VLDHDSTWLVFELPYQLIATIDTTGTEFSNNESPQAFIVTSYALDLARALFNKTSFAAKFSFVYFVAQVTLGAYLHTPLHLILLFVYFLIPAYI